VSRADYLAALHAAFDARRDPLDDAAVRDWLSSHPEDLTEFAAMRATLAPPVPMVAARRPNTLLPMLFPPLAAAAALLLFLRTDRASVPAEPPPPSAVVLAASSTVTVAPAATVYPQFAGAGVLASSISITRTPAF
jgi:hypothetical protein